MRTSTNRGRRCTGQATARLAKAEVFRQFQYLTVPLHQLKPVITRGAETMNNIFRQDQAKSRAVAPGLAPSVFLLDR